MTDQIEQRADIILVEAGLAKTRSQAKLLILEGVVFSHGEVVKKPSQLIFKDQLEVRKEIIYVGRGAHKIEKALQEFNINVADFVVADVGASTGGFTDYVLKHGAKKVYAIDVGHGQLAESLRKDSRVINCEGTNVRYIEDWDEECDLAVVDLSFISLRLCMQAIFKLVKQNAPVITLFKPQFEVGKDRIGDGVVRDDVLRQECLDEFLKFCIENGFNYKKWILSPLQGKDGNIEYLIHFVRN